MSGVVNARTVVASAVVGVVGLALSTAVVQPAGLTAYIARGIGILLAATIAVHAYRVRRAGPIGPDREGGPRG